MVVRAFKTKDRATPAWQNRRARSSLGRRKRSTRGLARRAVPPSLFLTRTARAGRPVQTPQQLTHALGREHLAARRALARGIQLLRNAPRRPARGLALAHALQQGGSLGNLRPGV